MTNYKKVSRKLEMLCREYTESYSDLVEFYDSKSEADSFINQELSVCLYDNRYGLTMSEYDELHALFVEGMTIKQLEDYRVSSEAHDSALAVCGDIIQSFRRGSIPDDIAADAIRREFIDWEVRYY